MDTTSTGVVSRIINEGRQTFGAVTEVEVPRELWEQVMDEVANAGGDVGFESCAVDGVTVRSLSGDVTDATPRYRVAGDVVPRTIS